MGFGTMHMEFQLRSLQPRSGKGEKKDMRHGQSISTPLDLSTHLLAPCRGRALELGTSVKVGCETV
jgi:hypothetical protein